MRGTRNGEQSPTEKLSVPLAHVCELRDPLGEQRVQLLPSRRRAADNFPTGRDILRRSPDARERWNDPSMESRHLYIPEGGEQFRGNSSCASAPSRCERNAGGGRCGRWCWNYADI